MMKKKQITSPVGNTLVKEQVVDDQPALPPGIERIVDEDAEARRVKLAEIKDKIASGRYDISSDDVAKAIIAHVADAPKEE